MTHSHESHMGDGSQSEECHMQKARLITFSDTDARTMNEGTRYLEKVFKSIKKNARTLEGRDEALQELLVRVQKFYVSLFGSKNGMHSF